MKLAIVGAGAVGMMIVSALLRGKGKELDICWVVRNNALRELIRDEGINVHIQKSNTIEQFSPSEDERISQIQEEEKIPGFLLLPKERPSIVIKTDKIKLLGDVQELVSVEPNLVLSCVKAYDIFPLRSAIKMIPAFKVFITNGFWLNPGFDLGVLFGGGYCESNHLSVGMGGKLVIGRIKSPHASFLLSFTEETPAGALIYNLNELEFLETFCNSLDETILRAEVIADIYPIMLKKAIINCIINPLTGITGSRNGFLMEKWARDVRNCLLSEIFRVIQKAHFLPPTGESITLEGMLNEVEEVSNLTASNLSSMTIDIARKEPTEIRFLNHVIATLGERYGIPTPLNSTVIELVELLSR